MLKESEYVIIAVGVPLKAADKVRNAMHSAGAGVQGKYDHVSGSHRKIGRFRPRDGAHPAIGEVGKMEEVEEEYIEMLCHKDRVAQVVAALRKTHPYEEPSIDIIPRLELEQ